MEAISKIFAAILFFSVPTTQTSIFSLVAEHAVKVEQEGVMIDGTEKMECTAFPISKSGRFLTAGHCVPKEHTVFVGPNRWLATVTEVSYSDDVAVITTGGGGDSLKPLKLGSKPKPGDYARGEGWGFDVPVPMLVDCLVVAVDTSVASFPEEWSKHRMLFSRSFGGGMSGGPIYDRKGKVISILQASGGADYRYLVGVGASYDVLKKLYEKYGD